MYTWRSYGGPHHVIWDPHCEPVTFGFALDGDVEHAAWKNRSPSSSHRTVRRKRREPELGFGSAPVNLLSILYFLCDLSLQNARFWSGCLHLCFKALVELLVNLSLRKLKKGANVVFIVKCKFLWFRIYPSLFSRDHYIFSIFSVTFLISSRLCFVKFL